MAIPLVQRNIAAVAAPTEAGAAQIRIAEFAMGEKKIARPGTILPFSPPPVTKKICGV
jgi:hypothetical protein